MPSDVHIFGIRHHGPGCARSLLRALEELTPDCVLVEGPPEGDELLPLLAHEQMRPPVALMVYADRDPTEAIYYPFADFSPEYQAILYGLRKATAVRFMDLPQVCQLGAKQATTPEIPSDEPAAALRRDPLAALAESAGHSDSERWWEQMVEQRGAAGGLFEAILYAISALRESIPKATNQEDLTREACMRQTIRRAQNEGFRRIAVVCGAWHAPALAKTTADPEDPRRLDDAPRVKVAAAWIPWTFARLCNASGYGAGVQAPGWYEHLWRHSARDIAASQPADLTITWMTRIARLLRAEDLDASAAGAIEAVRLAEALAALRDRPLPGLLEMTEAAQTVICLGDSMSMRLVEEKLLVGERLGQVPDAAPLTPLQRDLERLWKRLKLSPQARQETVELDLRNEIDLERSLLLHRLSLMGIEWGKLEGPGGAGTFAEVWRVQWQPQFAAAVTEKSRWGNSVPDAASAFARDAAASATDLATLTALMGRTLFADLPGAMGSVLDRLDAEAAIQTGVNPLMDALPALAQTLRYGSARRLDTPAIARIGDRLVARVCVGLSAAAASLNDDAAVELFARMDATQDAVALLRKTDHLEQWRRALERLSDSQTIHGLIAGRATRLLWDARHIDAASAGTRMSLALSPANFTRGAAWIEGFLRGAGLLLLHDQALWELIDQWVIGLPQHAFMNVLPLLRRTFSSFEAAELRQMHQHVKTTRGIPPARELEHELDIERADAVLPLITRILGLN